MKLQKVHLWLMQSSEFHVDHPENKTKPLFSTFVSLSQEEKSKIQLDDV